MALFHCYLVPGPLFNTLSLALCLSHASAPVKSVMEWEKLDLLCPAGSNKPFWSVIKQDLLWNVVLCRAWLG